MSIIEDIKVTPRATLTKFSIRLNDDESVEFRPTETFKHVTIEQVLKIIAKSEIAVTAENNRNKVNFKLTGKDKLFGFVNYYDNDLDDESGDDEIDEVVTELSAKFAKVKATDITLPMTAKEADKLINSL